MDFPPSFLSDVPRETKERLERFRDLVIQWQKTINLVSDASEIWERHVADSAQLITFLPKEKSVILDMGSGAGFPGMILAILSQHEVHLVDSDKRKAVFLSEAARMTGTPVHIHARRVDEIVVDNVRVITARAVAPLSYLIAMAKPHLHPDSFCLFPKGKKWSMEVDDARLRWHFDLETYPSQTSDDGVVLFLRNISERIL